MSHIKPIAQLMAMLDGLSGFEVRMLSMALVGFGACGLLLSSDPISERLFAHKVAEGTESRSSIEGQGRSSISVPEAVEGDPLQIYIWKLEDFYQHEGEVLRPMAGNKTEVNAQRKLLWTHESSGPFWLQISQDPELSSDREFKSSPRLVLELEKLKLGKTFWRVSADGKRWSDAKSFKVEAKFLDSRATVRVNRIGSQFVELSLATTGNEHSFLVDMSQDEGFSSASTETKLSEGSNLRQLVKPGRYFVRTRAMNSIQEVTDLSPPISFVAP